MKNKNLPVYVVKNRKSLKLYYTSKRNIRNGKNINLPTYLRDTNEDLYKEELNN
jgi:hypothetical protein